MDATNETPVTPGQLLAEARERQGLSRAEIAHRLHMSPSQVEALEAGDYARLPRGTFLRGFVRNYAKLVGLEAESLVSGLAQAAPVDGAPRIVVPSQNIRFEPLHERISGSPYWKGGVIAGIVLAFGAAALYWWAEIRNAPPPSVASAPAPSKPAAQQLAVAPLPAAETPPPTEAPKVDPATPAPTTIAAAPPATSATPDVAKKPEPAKAPEPPKGAPAKVADTPKKAETPKPPEAAKTAEPKATDARLAFRFRGESWVEVKDASGKTLFSRLNAAGSVAQVAGKPPLTVIVGNAPDVSLRYNDREFPLEPHTKVAVARFTVE